MTSTYATLAFSPLADALMAGLASRAHQWTSWEMLQIRSFEVEWGADRPERIFLSSGRMELRIVVPEIRAPLTASTSLDVSPSVILASLLLEKVSLGRPLLRLTTLLENSAAMKLQTLDQNLGLEDPWTLPLSQWSTLMPTQPNKIEDLRYRNSSGFVGYSIPTP